MKLNNIPFTGSFGAAVESRIHGLLFRFEKAKGDATTGAALIDALDATTLKITKNTSTGTQTKVYEQSLIHLLEVGALEGGSLRAGIVRDNLTVTGVFVLSKNGAETLNDRDSYKVIISGLPDGVTGDVWVLDAPLNASTQFEYNAMRVTANTPKQTNIKDAHYLAIPRSVFKAIDLYYPNNQTVNYDADEIESLTASGSPLALIIDGKAQPGGYNYYTLPVGVAEMAKIDVSDDTAVILVNISSL